MKRALGWLVGILSTVPLLAQAREADAAAPRMQLERPAVQYSEIERGFHFGLSSGGWFILAAPSDRSVRPFSSGQSVQFSLGVDLGSRLAVDLFLLASGNRAGSDYTGFAKPGVASGDFYGLTPGLDARIYLLGFDDSQDVTRTWLYLRLGAGALFTFPSALRPNMDVIAFGGPGVQYFTRLRHFAIGLDATFNFYVLTQSMGFAVTPFVKYAF